MIRSLFGFGLSLLLLACRKGDGPAPTPSEPPAPATVGASLPDKRAAESGDGSGASPAQEAPPKAAPPAQKKRYVALCLGDSITDERVGGGGYLSFLRAACPGSKFISFGRGGDMTNQMRRRLDTEILPHAGEYGATTLLVYGGVNDLYSDLSAGRSVARITEDLSEIYREGRAHGLDVVALSVSPWGGFKRYANPKRLEATRILNSWILGQVEKGEVRAAVDTYPLLSCGDPSSLCPEYETRSHDGIHPGPLGHERIGRAVFEAAFVDCE